MKNPKVLIIVVIVILVLAGGAFYFMQNKKGGSESGLANTVKNVMTNAASMECNYTDEQGRTTKAYVKNGLVRADYTAKTAQESGSIIVTKEKMYMWTADNKGYTYDIPQVTITPGAQTSGQTPDKKTEFMNEMDKYKSSCKNANVSDDLFTPPSDVTFTDYSDIQKNMMAPQTQGGNPAGMTEEQKKAYQQYLNQAQQNIPNASGSNQ